MFAGSNRSAYIPYDENWQSGPDYKWIAVDQQHQQIFFACVYLDRVDVLSAVDYHLIHSIIVPSPSSVDISPDGTTLAVASSGAHIFFFDTGTFAEVNDIIFPDSALGATSFLYTANGNGVLRAGEGLESGGGITAYWDHTSNSFVNSNSGTGTTGVVSYNTTGLMARSGDYSRILLGYTGSGGDVQLIDGNTGQVLQEWDFRDWLNGLAINRDASRYAFCLSPNGGGGFLFLLDGSFNQIYQDNVGCIGMAFSPDGQTLYREVYANGADFTQALDMTSFTATNTADLFVSSSGTGSQWEAADATGMVYGILPNPPSGPVFTAVDTTQSSTSPIPVPSDPVTIVHVISNVASPQGGDQIQLLCSGIDNVSTSSISVKIGGNAATVVSAAAAPIYSPTNLRLLTVKTPPGTPGIVDVQLTANGTTVTAKGGFQYAQASKIFPFATSPNFLLYDSLRQKLYASHQDQVEVIDPIAQQVLTPLVPAGGKLANSQFSGLSLSPDGNRLYIADSGANLIHVLDLTNPGTGKSIDPGAALGWSSPLPPARVFETSTGQLVGSDASGDLFEIDPSSGSGTQIVNGFGSPVSGMAWNSAKQGQYVLISMGNGDTAQIYLFDASSSELFTSPSLTLPFLEASVNEDGTVIAVGGSYAVGQNPDPEFVGIDLNPLGILSQHFDASVPFGTPSFFLHPSGALIYKAGTSPVGGALEIGDVRNWQDIGQIVFPEPFLTSNSTLTDHMLTTDDTGQYLFGITQSGITMMVLDTIPLSIGNTQPASGTAGGGETLSIRGSGFQQGTTLTIGGVAAAATYVDANTLTITQPPLPAGWQDLTVSNAGQSYTAPGLFHVETSESVPVITGYSPSALTSLAPIESVTILGSGFDVSDSVNINGEPIDSAFVDSSHISAVIPNFLTATTGTIPLTVVSGDGAASNTLLLPIVNAIPAIMSVFPETITTGSSATTLQVLGSPFVSASVVQWNGQNLSTSVAAGSTDTGEQVAIAQVPADLVASSATATITVFNPAPGGGTSNAVTLDVSPAHADVIYPTAIDFGTALAGSPTITQPVELDNIGSANYTITSVNISAGPFSVQPNTCVNLPPTTAFTARCILQVQLSPNSAGTFQSTLTITDNVAGSPHNIPVTATATQTLVPTVAITTIDSVGETVSVGVHGTATVGGSNVPATAWVEYGSDTSLNTYTKSATTSFTGDNTGLLIMLNGLTPGTPYGARLAVQTSGGTGKSAIQVFSTEAAGPSVMLGIAQGGSSTATINAGQTATYQLVVSDGGNGYIGTATFSCVGAPLGATCNVSPARATIGMNSVPITVTVTTTAPTVAKLHANFPETLVCLLGLCLGACVSIRQRGKHLLLVCVLASLLLLPSCGGGSGGSSSSTSPPVVATPAGSYSLTVNISAGGVSTGQLLTLTVK